MLIHICKTVCVCLVNYRAVSIQSTEKIALSTDRVKHWYSTCKLVVGRMCWRLAPCLNVFLEDSQHCECVVLDSWRLVIVGTFDV